MSEARVLVLPGDETRREACHSCGVSVIRFPWRWRLEPARFTSGAKAVQLEVGSVLPSVDHPGGRTYRRHEDTCRGPRRRRT